jgi:predicted secreted hydrolase
VSDLAGSDFHVFDRLQRAGAGWAGALVDRYEVWNGSWRAEARADGSHHVQASDAGTSIDFELRGTGRHVLHGQDGYSRKGADPSNASEYYSLPRLDTRGTLAIAGQRFDVSGLSWMDHEFGTTMLEAGQSGWDWFGLQLDDGRDLMLYQMRRKDGSRDRYSSGSLLSRDGRAVHLDVDGYQLRPGETWESPATHTRYPVRWHLTVPGQQLVLDVAAVMPNQELHTPRTTGVTYWEGAVDVSGTAGGRRVRGRGYMELTGYAGSLSESLR